MANPKENIEKSNSTEMISDHPRYTVKTVYMENLLKWIKDNNYQINLSTINGKVEFNSHELYFLYQLLTEDPETIISNIKSIPPFSVLGDPNQIPNLSQIKAQLLDAKIKMDQEVTDLKQQLRSLFIQSNDQFLQKVNLDEIVIEHDILLNMIDFMNKNKTLFTEQTMNEAEAYLTAAGHDKNHNPHYEFYERDDAGKEKYLKGLIVDYPDLFF